MYKDIFIARRTVPDAESRPILLSYFITRQELETRDVPFAYGIKITKSYPQEHTLCPDSETAPSISCSESLVRSMLDLFIRCAITPISLLELVDESVSSL